LFFLSGRILGTKKHTPSGVLVSVAAPLQVMNTCFNLGMFNESKVAQMAAWFLSQSHTHKMPHLKLMKLLYLSDRQSLKLYESSISGDHVVAMPHGPVLTMTLDYINGAVSSSVNAWESLISDRSHHQVSLRKAVSRDDLDDLSDADISILESTWKKFGEYSQWELVEYTHTHCKEWKDPQGSSHPISFASIFRALGRSHAESKELEANIQDEADINALLASL